MTIFPAEAAAQVTPATVGSDTHGVSPYMGGLVELATAPNGAVINMRVLDNLPRVIATQPTVQQVADGVHTIMGYSIANCSVIEGDDGLIIYDTGDTKVEGEHFLEVIRTISPKPVTAIIYSHSHYPFGAGAIAAGQPDVLVIGHANLNANVTESGGMGGYFPELTPVQMGRHLQQYSNFAPETGPDAPVAAVILAKEQAFLPVNRPVQDGETLTVSGVTMQFFTEFHSDTTDCLTVWFPDKKLVLNNLFWPAMPNFYTLRGTTFRDPRNWRDGLKLIRDLSPEHLLSTHALPVSGVETVRESVSTYMDGVTFIFDQTLRGMLRGLGPEEVRHFVKLPPVLRDFPHLFEGIQDLETYPPYIASYALGWYGGDAATIIRVPPHVEAERMVAGWGGRERVLAAYEAAMGAHEYAWAAQLINYLYQLDPLDPEVRQHKADVLRVIGQITTGAYVRSWYLSQARALEGLVELPIVVLPSPDEIAAAAPSTFVDFFRVRLDPHKSSDSDVMVTFVFTDAGDQAHALHVRRGIAEFIDVPSDYWRQPDATIRLTRSAWATLYRNEATIKQALAAKEVAIRGDETSAVAFFGMFDQVTPENNRRIPQA